VAALILASLAVGRADFSTAPSVATMLAATTPSASPEIVRTPPPHLRLAGIAQVLDGLAMPLVLLTADDLTHYQKIIIALSETIRLMKEIDAVIEKHGGWPLK